MNRRDALKLAGLALALPAASVVQANEPFQIIEPAQKADDPSKIEVLEFFHYGCPHCRDFHPLITAWKKKLPADVAFRAVPAVWNNAQLGGLARLFYTAQVTGDLAALEPGLIRYAQVCDVPLVSTFAEYGEEASYERGAPGDGELPLADFVRALPRDIPIGLEAPMRAATLSGLSAEDRLRPALEKSRALLASL